MHTASPGHSCWRKLPLRFIDHATGIVIGETAVIEKKRSKSIKVVLGALSVSKRRYEKQKRHPTVEEDVCIYANATYEGTIRDRQKRYRGRKRLVSNRFRQNHC
jgi:hypothetical protein